MAANGYRVKSDAELSPYQKRVDKIDNVILCVAAAEKMLGEIGRSLFPGLEKTPVLKPRKKVAVFPWRGRKVGRQRTTFSL
ncbi:MAG TPA: hypothetical protein VK463_09175 [Desulfomonilaceae bacterium]|nr:hypothetical protein [Desulfomonilaceae bacterium]